VIFGSVCSGMEAASLAWGPLGWKPAFFSEIDKAPCALLSQRYPDTPNLGDMTKFEEWPHYAIDLLAGGTPCQSFSVAGLRKGITDPRGSLMLTYGAIAHRYRPRWLLWENVPGVLSSNGGRDFGSFLGMLAELGYGFAYRVLDAQFFGLAQRRKRVFVVGYLGDWRPPAAVLFERESLRGDPAPRREAGQRPAPTISARTKGGGGLGTDAELDGALIPEMAHALTASPANNRSPNGDAQILIPEVVYAPEHSAALRSRDFKGPPCDIVEPAFVVTRQVANTLLGKANSRHAEDLDNYVTHALRADGFDASEDGTGRGTPIVPIAFMSNESFDSGDNVNISPSLRIGSNGGGQPPAIAFSCKDHGADAGDLAPTLRAMGHYGSHANAGGQVAIAFSPTESFSSGVNYNIAPTLRTGGNNQPAAIAYQTSGNCGAWETGDMVGALDTMTDPNSHVVAIQAGATRENPDSGPDGVGVQEHIAYTLEARAEVQSVCVALADTLSVGANQTTGFPSEVVAYNITPSQSNKDYKARPTQRSQAITTDGNRPSARGGDIVATQWAVRRLTPRECERLQGAPDDHTLVTYRGKPMADGPRYKMIGNSWAVPCVRWIGERIDLVQSELDKAT
jgi:DNA (cytosine-5)-methyltransferase 1